MLVALDVSLLLDRLNVIPTESPAPAELWSKDLDIDKGEVLTLTDRLAEAASPDVLAVLIVAVIAPVSCG
ncbi:hypothetical protein TG4357_01675 [Thalassovita gelatinovora]|uniref:Uncharacterized protein n=1 Tax=Thalassovita gelatinovora TaxID=53501 RepID=A0A0P1FAK4_THAGE|nr:hypothetical protein TG4357_01675 [Thalassovita gelatinovora]